MPLEVAARVLRLLLQRDRLACVVELHDAVGPRVRDPVAEHRRPLDDGEPLETSPETGAIEDVVAEDQRAGLVTDEVSTDDERLGQPLGGGLLGIADRDAEP